MMPMNMRSLLQPLALTGLSLALAACVSSALSMRMIGASSAASSSTGA